MADPNARAYVQSWDELLLRWLRALWELVEETGLPQPLRPIAERAGMSTDDGVLASVRACSRKLAVRLEVTPVMDSEHSGHYLEFWPLGER